MKNFMSGILYMVLLFISMPVIGQVQFYQVGPNTKWMQGYNGITQITVYWENLGPGNATQREWVQQAVRATWEGVANVNFVGWGQYDNSGKGIRIYIDDYATPHTRALGTEINGAYQGMVLNFNFLGNYNCNGQTKENCIKAMAVHEFGHVLGIAHGRDNPDCPCAQFSEGYGGGNKGAYYVTPCDISSVMNYCDPRFSNNGKLSKYDIDGVQALYGARKEMLDNGGHTGFSTIINELNASNIWENITITIGSQQFLFNVNEGNKTEIKTFRFGTPGPFNYTISSVALNKNNTTYRMNGAGTIDIDNSKNYTINVAVNNNQPQNLILDVVDVSAAKKGVTVQPNRNDKRFGGIPAADVHAFLRNGQKPVGLLLLDEVQNEKFYIYADGVIQVFNIPNKSLLVCGQKAAPYYKSWNGKVWIWSFTRNIGNNVRQIYVISNTNEVWAMATDGNLYKYGYVTGVDF